jgi:hypothetical protein
LALTKEGILFIVELVRDRLPVGDGACASDDSGALDLDMVIELTITKGRRGGNYYE